MKKRLTVSLTFLLLFALTHIGSVFAVGTFSETKIDPLLLNAIEADPTALHRVIIFFTESPSAALVESYGVRVEYLYDVVPGLSCKLTGTLIEQIAMEQDVVRVELDSMVYALGKPDGSGGGGGKGGGKRGGKGGEDTWNIAKIGAPSAWEMGYTGQYWSKGKPHIQVAILDSGIDYDHPDLTTNCADYNNDGIIEGWDYVNNDNDPRDDFGHGTHVAGIVAAAKDDTGVVGTANAAHIYALKVLDSHGNGYWSWVIAALDWILKGPDGLASTYDDPEVAVMGFGTDIAPDIMRIVCENAHNNGITLVAAAGDDYSGVNYPAAFSAVIAVAATDSKNKVPSWSSSGPQVELAAPGVDIRSAYYDPATGKHTYTALSGTSMAAPHVAGTIALMLSKNPSFTQAYYQGDGSTLVNYIRSTLHDSAKDISTRKIDPNSGYGLVQAAEACTQF